MIADAVVLEMVAKALRGNEPPPAPPTHYEFATTLRLTGGPKKGRRYDPKSDACQRYLLSAIDTRGCTTIAVLGSPQVVGKTTSAILPVSLRAVIATHDNVGYGLPTLDALNTMWTTRLAPAINESGYGDHLPKRGPGSKGGRPAVVYFSDPDSGRREGAFVFMTGGAFGSTVRVVVIDDVDQFKRDGKPDREAVEDIRHRTDSYGDKALCLIVGTIEHDEGSIIVAIIDESTGTVPWARCPHCQRHQRLVWENVVADYSSEESSIASARYRCDHCAVLWTENDRQKAIDYRVMLFCDRGQTVEGGVVVGPASRSLTFGLTVTALDASLANLEILCKEYRSAKVALERGDHALMRKFYRYRLCRTYTSDADEHESGNEITWQRLLERSRSCTWGPSLHLSDRAPELEGHLYSRHVADPPSDAIGCTAGVDIQNNRAYVSLVAFAVDSSTWDAAWSYEFARPDHRPWSTGELHAMLDRIDGLLHAWARDLPLVAIGLDVGDFTADLMPWLAGHRGTWFPIKGQKTVSGESRLDVPGIVKVNEAGLHLLGVDQLRELIHASYRRPNGSAGAAHIPNGLSNNASDTAYLKHLCAERVVIDPKTKKRRLVQGPGRWDWQDARRIAEALIRKHLHAQNLPPPKIVNAKDWFNSGRRQ